MSLTYISDCRVDTGERAREIEEILEEARQFNRTNAITGALLYTGRRFVQTLEGPLTVIGPLVRRIERDPRHMRVVVIDRREISQRFFPLWAMAYAGPSVFVSRSLERALAPTHPNHAAAAGRLLRLIAEFARQPILPSEL